MGTASPDGAGRLLTVFEAATVLRVSKATIYQLAASGSIESVRDGRSILIPEAAIIPQAGRAAPPARQQDSSPGR